MGNLFVVYTHNVKSMKVDDNVLARVYSFDLQFKGGKRTKFYRKLFGYKSKNTRQDEEGREKVYESFYPGMLTPLPHLRLGKSVIAVPKSAKGELDAFFEEEQWGSIDLYSFDGILPSDDRMAAMREVPGRRRITKDDTLESEIENLRTLVGGNVPGPEERRRIGTVLDHVEDLKKYDWSDDREFSEELDEKVRPLRKEI